MLNTPDGAGGGLPTRGDALLLTASYVCRSCLPKTLGDEQEARVSFISTIAANRESRRWHSEACASLDRGGGEFAVACPGTEGPASVCPGICPFHSLLYCGT